MNERRTEEHGQAETTIQAQRIVYIVPHDTPTNDDVSLIELWRAAWNGKWIILATSFALGILGALYAFTATEWYRADVLLAPARQETSSGLIQALGSMGGLANLTGIAFNGGGAAEPIAVLRSRDFARSFIEDNDLLRVFFEERWDPEAGRWEESDPKKWPDIRDGIKFFSEQIRTVSEDPQTGLVTLSIEWKEPETAASWASELVVRINNYLRHRALVEAEKNIAYLHEQLDSTNVATLRESIGRLLEAELQQLMVAKGNEEFAFRVVDGAQVPKERSRPNRILIVFVSMIIGGLLSTGYVLVRQGIRSGKERASSDDVSSANLR